MYTRYANNYYRHTVYTFISSTVDNNLQACASSSSRRYTSHIIPPTWRQ